MRFRQSQWPARAPPDYCSRREGVRAIAAQERLDDAGVRNESSAEVRGRRSATAHASRRQTLVAQSGGDDSRPADRSGVQCASSKRDRVRRTNGREHGGSIADHRLRRSPERSAGASRSVSDDRVPVRGRGGAEGVRRRQRHHGPAARRRQCRRHRDEHPGAADAGGGQPRPALPAPGRRGRALHCGVRPRHVLRGADGRQGTPAARALAARRDTTAKRSGGSRPRRSSGLPRSGGLPALDRRPCGGCPTYFRLLRDGLAGGADGGSVAFSVDAVLRPHWVTTLPVAGVRPW